MRLAIKLAYRNLIGAELRTWLNVVVLSFAFVVILWLKGIMAGWDLQAKTDMTDYETGGGLYWHENYDPYDSFTLYDSHGPVPEQFRDEIERGNKEPVLIVQGTMFPMEKMQTVNIRGINPGQTILKLPVITIAKLVYSLVLSGQPDAYEILERVDRNMYSENRIVESEMTIHGRRSSRIITARTWVVSDERSFTEYLSLQREGLFARTGQLLKRTQLKDLSYIDGRWFPTTIIFSDVLKEGDGTEFRINRIEFNAEVPEHIISRAALSQ